VQPEIILR